MTRRDLVRTACTVGAGLVLGPVGGLAGDAGASIPKRILVLGGTGFIGPHTVRYAVSRGHKVTIFTRGRSDAKLPPGVERLVGDRNDDHSALEGRQWDVVIDNNAQDYRWVQTSTRLLKSAVQQYILVSSISAYAGEGFSWTQAGRVQREPAINVDHRLLGPPPGWQYGDQAPYGLMKALSEGIVLEAFPGRATIVRPTLIVGPGDRTNRFSYWPLRLAEGGEVLAPGNPEHSTQVIDQRDLTEWHVHLAEGGINGVFNGAGPAGRLSFRSMLEQVGNAVSKSYDLTWIPESFLQTHGVSPWSDMPAWIPGDPLMYVDIAASLKAGLVFRPLPTTARDVLAFEGSRPLDETKSRTTGLSRERERVILEAWHRS